jgi:hypothetical protein
VEEMLDRVLKLPPKHPFLFNNPLFAIDSTTIPLYLSLYAWYPLLANPIFIPFEFLFLSPC